MRDESEMRAAFQKWWPGQPSYAAEASFDGGFQAGWQAADARRAAEVTDEVVEAAKGAFWSAHGNGGQSFDAGLRAALAAAFRMAAPDAGEVERLKEHIRDDFAATQILLDDVERLKAERDTARAQLASAENDLRIAREADAAPAPTPEPARPTDGALVVRAWRSPDGCIWLSEPSSQDDAENASNGYTDLGLHVLPPAGDGR